jgi:hypothetical protein
MQQVDEGLIHAWLDGQLKPDEAARVERLVANDAAWSAAAAEARGLVAGASRILSALDDVPSVPQARERRTNRRPMWTAPWFRAAAGIVLIAGVAGVVLPRMSDNFGAEKPFEAAVMRANDQAAAPAALSEVARDTAVQLQKRAAQAPVPAPSAPPRDGPRREAAPERDGTSATADVRADVLPTSPQMRTAATASAPGTPQPPTANAAAGVGSGVEVRSAEDRARVAPPVVEQGMIGGTMGGGGGRGGRGGASLAAAAAAKSLAQLEPSLAGCWAAASTADARANELRDAAPFVLRFIEPVVTDVVRPPLARATQSEAARFAAAPAPPGARVQNATARRTSDTTYVAEWIESGGRVEMTFGVRADTLRGTTVLSSGDARFAPRPLLATKVLCP